MRKIHSFRQYDSLSQDELIEQLIWWLDQNDVDQEMDVDAYGTTPSDHLDYIISRLIYDFDMTRSEIYDIDDRIELAGFTMDDARD